MTQPSTITTNSGKPLQVGFIVSEALMGIISELKEQEIIQDVAKEKEGTSDV